MSTYKMKQKQGHVFGKLHKLVQFDKEQEVFLKLHKLAGLKIGLSERGLL